MKPHNSSVTKAAPRPGSAASAQLTVRSCMETMAKTIVQTLEKVECKIQFQNLPIYHTEKNEKYHSCAQVTAMFTTAKQLHLQKFDLTTVLTAILSTPAATLQLHSTATLYSYSLQLLSTA